ncbi:MAG: hypothetical protein CL920_32515 [Deltaproteobacteria bacterium]|nr:hypothetical protein [Deltaproteobacteria bacterium]
MERESGGGVVKKTIPGMKIIQDHRQVPSIMLDAVRFPFRFKMLWFEPGLSELCVSCYIVLGGSL